MKKIRMIIVLFIIIFSVSVFADELDSLLTSKISEMDNQLSLISNRMHEYDISKTYIHNDIVIFATIVTVLFILFTIISAYLIPKNTKKVIKKKIEEQEEHFNNFTVELDELHERISKTEGRVLRSLFENGLSGRNWQFIWGIRYCEYLYKKNDEGALKEILKMSYNLYEGNIKASEFNEEIKSNLTEILKEIIQSKDKNVINIASNLIREFTQ